MSTLSMVARYVSKCGKYSVALAGKGKCTAVICNPQLHCVLSNSVFSPSSALRGDLGPSFCSLESQTLEVWSLVQLPTVPFVRCDTP